MITIEWVFFGQMVIGVCVIFLLRKVTKMKKALDGIIKEIKEYVTFIIDEEETSEKEMPMYKAQDSVKNLKRKNKSKEMVKDEAQTRLIQAVLSEYFQ